MQKKITNIDVWLQIGDNIYEGIYNSYKANKITLDQVLEIQRKYYIYSYTEECQSSLMRNCINMMIQDNNEYYSRIGQYQEYTSSDPFFKNYFENIYERIVKKYQLFLFDQDNYFSIRKIGAYKVLFLNNIFSFYDTSFNLSDRIQECVKVYFDEIGQRQNPIIFMSRALENYTPIVSDKSTIRKSNTYQKQYPQYLKMRENLLKNYKTSFTFGGDNHFYFLKKHFETFSKTGQRQIFDACSSGITVIDSDEDFDDNILSVALNDNSKSKFITFLKSKDYSTLLFKLSKTKATYTFYYFNSDTNEKVKKDKQKVYLK